VEAAVLFFLVLFIYFEDGEGVITVNLIDLSSDLRAMIAQSVQCWATGWMIRVLGFDYRWGLGIFLFTTVSRTALGLTQPPIQWVPWE
jgi:hypothetical protein